MQATLRTPWSVVHNFGHKRSVGYRTRKPWLPSDQDSARAMPPKQFEQRKAVRVSWFTESEACSEVVIGTVQ